MYKQVSPTAGVAQLVFLQVDKFINLENANKLLTLCATVAVTLIRSA